MLRLAQSQLLIFIKISRFIQHHILNGWCRSSAFWLSTCVWLIILLVPSYNQITSFVIENRDTSLYSYPDVGLQSDLMSQDSEYKGRVEMLSGRDAEIALEEGRPNNYKPANDLVKRYPNDVVVLTQYLRQVLVSSFPVRRPYYLLPSGTTDYGENKPAYTQLELKQLLVLAHRGQSLESRNTFFDWAAISFLFELHRDAQAFQLLRQASHKKHYDDHHIEVCQAIVQTHQKLHPLMFEHKYMDCTEFSSSPLSVFSGYRETFLWLAWRAEQQGKARQALELRADVARSFGNVIRGRSNSSAIGFRRALWEVWSTKRKTRPRLWRINETYAIDTLSARFRQSAIKLGRPDIARETAELAVFAKHLQKLDKEEGSKIDVSRLKLSFLSFASVLILSGSGIYFLAFVCMGPVVFKTREEHTARQVWVPAAAWICAASLGLLLMRGCVLRIASAEPLNTTSAYVFVAGMLWYFLLPLCGAAFVCFLSAWRHHPASGNSFPWRQRWHLYLEERFARKALRHIGDFICAAIIIQIIAYITIQAYLVITHTYNIQIPVGILAVDGKFPIYADGISAMIECSIAILMLLVIYGVLIYRWGTTPEQRIFTLPALRRSWRILGATVALQQVVFLVFLLGTLPVRAAAERQIDTFLQVGMYQYIIQTSKPWRQKFVTRYRRYSPLFFKNPRAVCKKRSRPKSKSIIGEG